MSQRSTSEVRYTYLPTGCLKPYSILSLCVCDPPGPDECDVPEIPIPDEDPSNSTTIVNTTTTDAAYTTTGDHTSDEPVITVAVREKNDTSETPVINGMYDFIDMILTSDE